MVGVNGTEGEVMAIRRSLSGPAISPLIISPNSCFGGARRSRSPAARHIEDTRLSVSVD